MSSIAEKWEELSGKNNWEGLIDPLDIDLRGYLIQYGEMAKACTDAFITEKKSKNAGANKYSPENLFSRVGLSNFNEKYRVTKYFYGTSAIPLGDDIILISKSKEAWSNESNWMGYISVATDEGKVALGRRDIVVVWRGTNEKMKWVNDDNLLYAPAPIIFGDEALPQVHQGFYSLYTSKDPNSLVNKNSSSRDQIFEEVKELVEKYKDEKVSISVTGHNLGASMATLTAVDIAFNKLNKEFPVTAFPFASPKVGDTNFKAAFGQVNNNLHILRVNSVCDKVPKLPYRDGYEDIGEVLQIDTSKSPYLNDQKEIPADDLENYLHGVAGYKGSNEPFELVVNRDYTLLNKQAKALKDNRKIPNNWWVQRRKGMVQQKDGSWLLQDREDYPFN